MTWEPNEDRESPEYLQGLADHWGKLLDLFDKYIYPTFANHGISRETALLLVLNSTADE